MQRGCYAYFCRHPVCPCCTWPGRARVIVSSSSAGQPLERLSFSPSDDSHSSSHAASGQAAQSSSLSAQELQSTSAAHDPPEAVRPLR